MSARQSGSASKSTPLLPDEYENLIEQVRETAEAAIPRNATVLVVSRGDEELLRIGPRRALHFPQDEFGGYAGYHPQDSAAVIELLEGMRARGSQYMLLPRTDFWWLDFYTELNDHLASNYPLVASNDECMVFELVAGVQAPLPEADDTAVPAATSDPELAGQLDQLLRALLPEDARVAVVTGGAPNLPSFDECVAVRPSDEGAGLAAVLDGADREGAEFLAIPATARDRVHMGEQPPATAGRWRIVTRQEHVGEVWERGSQFPVGGSPPVRRGFLQRVAALFRKD